MILIKTLPVLIAFFLLSGCAKQNTSNTHDVETKVQESKNQEKNSEESQSSMEQAFNSSNSSKTLADAIENAKPRMTDEFDAFPAAAGVLAYWMQNNATKIGDIKNVELTKRGRILKDSYNERGKRLCVSGNVVEIQVDRSGGFPAYHAGIMNNNGDVTRVLAVGSTGDLVADSNATFCGIVIGKVGFTNAMGGTTSAPYLIGMFDLPENH